MRTGHETYYPPGSLEATQHGCTCPIMDNARGKGAYEKDGEPMYWVSETCPLHGGQEDDHEQS